VATLLIVVATALVVVACLAAGRLLPGWLALGVALAALWWTHALAGPAMALVLAVAWGVPLLLLGVAPVRRALVAPLLLRAMGRVLPTLSDTEREALEAGTVWFDGQIFSGAPHWKNLLSFRPRELTARERAFLDGPLAELCRNLDDWQVQQRGDLPEETWGFLRRHGFFGLIIPTEHGGLGFSARAHSEVIARLSTRSVAAAVTVMVPNSLGPAELLLHYGTDEQKRHWLPRLARGDEIPCFALTGPENGSDAAAMGAEGVVFRRTLDGRDELALRLSWDKRYTTLGPRATVIGLAFRLRDPERLLGGDPEPGISVALVPAATPGVEIGARHDPLGVPFLNGPTRGRDVVVPADALLGGPARAGHGWRMLMDCLAAGRSISLPSLSAGCCQLALRHVAAYAGVRQQFGLPIGRFEGVEERLARMAGNVWLVDAARTLTGGAVDAGEKPSVLSAICKAWCTEAMRQSVTDGMDVLGGAGISRGPRNLLARAWQAVPIGITVEGANILTRSLIVFGQGAVRCHPWVQQELAAAAAHDAPAFDRAFFGHVAFTVRNAARAPLLALVDGGTPDLPLPRAARRLFGRLTRLSAAFAFVADVSMATLGSELKRREMLSGRLADALAWQYLGAAALKRWADDGCPDADRPVALWAAEHAVAHAHEALAGVLDNLPNRPAAWLSRALVYPLGARVRGPSDRRTHALAAALLDGGELRERLTRSVHLPGPEDPALGRMEAALALALAAAPGERKLKDALRAGTLPPRPEADLPTRAAGAGVLSDAERSVIERARHARRDAVQVDAFEPDEFAKLRG